MRFITNAIFVLYSLLIFLKVWTDHNSIIMVRISKCCGTTLTSSLVLDLPLMIGYPHSRVSNETGQCNFLGQTDRSSFIVKGQRNKLKILPWDGAGQDSLSKYGTGHGTEQSLFFCQNPGRDRDGTGQLLFFSYDFLFYNISSCFRTYFSCFRTSFSCFWFFGVSDFVPGCQGQRNLSQDFWTCPCPGRKRQRDKDFSFVPGQRHNGTSRPRVSRDVSSLGIPTLIHRLKNMPQNQKFNPMTPHQIQFHSLAHFNFWDSCF